MKKILLSLALVLVAGTAFAASSTGAFLSDTESSTGNTFTAGAIDLKIDNHSYYNGNECKEVTAGIFQWVGSAPFPLAGSPCTTTWSLSDLQNGGVTIHKFFDFSDIKPSDYSEDTISIHVDNNDSYLCANVKLTSNDENTCTDPELQDEPGCTSPGLGQGQLAQNVNFIWWADDGDNVLENGETVISSGPIGAITLGSTTTIPLADTGVNIWNPNSTGGSLAGGVTKYIGKAWCFGAITPSPLSQSSLPGGRATTTPAEDGNGNQIPGEPADGGYLCDGSPLNNSTQTDSLTADVTFNAVQARHNDRFVCLKRTSLTLVKVVNIQGGGTAVATDWTLTASGPTPLSGVTGSAAVTSATVTPGQYTLGETGPSGYLNGTYNCVVNGGQPVAGNSVTLADGDSATCTVTNTFRPATLTITKIVNNTHGGNNVVADFQLFAVGNIVTQFTSGVSQQIPPGAYTITEQGVNGYQAAFTGDCDVAGNVTLAAGETKNCTITNSDIAPNITLVKAVTGTGPLDNPVTFTLKVDGNVVPQNTSVAVTANSAHTIDEVQHAGYVLQSITGTSNYGHSCPAVLGGSIVLAEGEAITCTITNHKGAI